MTSACFARSLARPLWPHSSLTPQEEWAGKGLSSSPVRVVERCSCRIGLVLEDRDLRPEHDGTPEKRRLCPIGMSMVIQRETGTGRERSRRPFTTRAHGATSPLSVSTAR